MRAAPDDGVRRRDQCVRLLLNCAANPALPPPAVDGVRAEIAPLMRADVSVARLVWLVFRRYVHIP